jgi:hypothetical protein
MELDYITHKKISDNHICFRKILGYNIKYNYYLRLDVIEWCVENVGRVDLEQDGIACRLTFESDGAAILFAMHFNVEFALCN